MCQAAYHCVPPLYGVRLALPWRALGVLGASSRSAPAPAAAGKQKRAADRPAAAALLPSLFTPSPFLPSSWWRRWEPWLVVFDCLLLSSVCLYGCGRGCERAGRRRRRGGGQAVERSAVFVFVACCPRAQPTGGPRTGASTLPLGGRMGGLGRWWWARGPHPLLPPPPPQRTLSSRANELVTELFFLSLCSYTTPFFFLPFPAKRKRESVAQHGASWEGPGREKPSMHPAPANGAGPGRGDPESARASK